MARSDDTLRWQFLLDEDRWESGAERALPLDSPKGGQGQIVTERSVQSRFDRIWLMGFAALALAALVSLFWLWREAQAGLAQVEDELNGAIELEIWAAERNDRAMAVGLLDENADPVWRNQIMTRFYPMPPEDERVISARITDFDLKESLALVQVTVTDNRVGAPYQETRVYRQTQSGWIRTAPGPEFWGAWQSQESDYFVFLYRERDRDAVLAAAPEIDRLYERTYRAIGLPLTSEEKIQVEVRINGTITRGSTRNANGRVLAVLSPELLPRPLGLSTERTLTESVIHQVINLVIWERMDRIPGDWQSIRSGLRLWLLWKTDGVLAQSRADIVRWLYEQSTSQSGRMQVSFPRNYTALCQSFWLWQLHPYEIGIPLTCDQTEGQVFIPVRMAVEVRQLPMPEMAPEYRGSWTRLNTGRAVAVATLLEYVEMTYGPASVTEILARTRTHLRWQNLIPDVLDTPIQEFEAEWQAYVREISGLE